MYARIFLLLVCVCSVCINSYSQTYTYSYTDPCTGIMKSINVPGDGINVTYYGQIKNFTTNDFLNGYFEQCANGIYQSFGGNNPCSSLTGIPQSISIAQNTVLNTISIINSLSAISEIQSGSTNLLGDIITATSNSNSKKDNKKTTTTIDPETGKTTTTTIDPSSNTVTTTSVLSTTEVTGNNETTTTTIETTVDAHDTKTTTSTVVIATCPSIPTEGEAKSAVSSSTTIKEEEKIKNNIADTKKTTLPGSGSGYEEDQKQTNILGGSISAISSVGSNNKNGNKPTILASSDFVGFNFKNSDARFGGKFTGGYTSTRWDGKVSHGILADYTTALKGPNITGFYALLGKKRIDIISATITAGFDRRTSIYGTVAAGQMWTIDKLKMKWVVMATGSYGSVYGSSFLGSAAITGGMKDIKINQRLDVKVLFLYVYVPYMSYYNDFILKSPHIVLPIIGTNVKITKRFKININSGGAWAINENTLNYTLMMGTRLLL